MTTMAVDRVFVDTNVLVYATLPAAPLHPFAVASLQAAQQAGAELWISGQIVREFIATLTRPNTFAKPLTSAQAAQEAAQLRAAFPLAEDGPGVMRHLLALCQAFHFGGRQVHDANIVATMLEHGIAKLLTHNTADFVRFASVITVVPLVP